MILGIGHDITDIARIQRILEGPAGERFVNRILTPSERGHIASFGGEGAAFARTVQYVAGRFAAKEAVVKAIGCGLGRVAGFQDIEIAPDQSGKPHCRLSPRTLDELGWTHEARVVHITITHAGGLASAVAVVEQR